jgi:hypothetical protein
MEAKEMKRAWMVAAAMAAAAAACRGGQYRLTVVLNDNAGTLPRWVLRSAAEKAREALRTAGVETQWIFCPGCVLPPPGTYAVVTIVPERKAAAEGSEALGLAVECPAAQRCYTSWVFDRELRAFAKTVPRPVDEVLGYVMAHEMGHLMGLGHRPSGVMRADLRRGDLVGAERCLRFRADDAKKIRATVEIWTADTAAAATPEGM